MNSLLLGIGALLPLAIGPLPAGGKSLQATLCSGGDLIAITIPIRDRDPQLPPPCTMKGCHAGCSRKKFDMTQ